jgi:hypothetical protein
MTNPILLIATTVLIVLVFNNFIQKKDPNKDLVHTLMELTIVVSMVFLLEDFSFPNLSIVMITILATSCLTRNNLYKENFGLVKTMVHHDDTKAFYSFDHLYPSANNKETLEELKSEDNLTVNVEYPDIIMTETLDEKPYVPFEPSLIPETTKQKNTTTTQPSTTTPPPDHPVEFDSINNVVIENTFNPKNMSMWEKIKFIFQ